MCVPHFWERLRTNPSLTNTKHHPSPPILSGAHIHAPGLLTFPKGRARTKGASATPRRASTSSRLCWGRRPKTTRGTGRGTRGREARNGGGVAGIRSRSICSLTTRSTRRPRRKGATTMCACLFVDALYVHMYQSIHSLLMFHVHTIPTM